MDSLHIPTTALTLILIVFISFSAFFSARLLDVNARTVADMKRITAKHIVTFRILIYNLPNYFNQ